MKAKVLCMLLSATLMASCTTLANIIVEDTIQDMVNHPGKTQGSTSTTKALDKERIQMIKEGKCPVCMGVGKSIDGKYVCATCNGTGKYIEQNNTPP